MEVKILREQVNIPNTEINFQQIFNTIKDTMASLGYDVDDSSYKYQRKGDVIKQVQSLIEGGKIVDDYTMFVIQVEITIDNAKIIKKNGKTFLKGKNGKIVFLSKLNLDYDGKFAKDPILHFLKKIYEKYIYKTTRNKYEGLVTKDLYVVKNSIIELLDI